MIRRVGLISLVVGASMFGLVASAQGATVVGQTGTPDECADPDFGQVQITTAAPPTYTIPFDGTVTSFSAGTLSSGAQTKLLILQPVTGDTYQVVAKTDFATFTASGVQTFSTQIPVRAGQVIGQYGQVCALPTMSPSDNFAFFEDAEPATGANQSFPNPSIGSSRIDLSATVEPTQPPAPVAKTKCKKKKKHKRSAESAKKKCKKKKK
jgi:hypothetical protein